MTDKEVTAAFLGFLAGFIVGLAAMAMIVVFTIR